MLNSNFTIIKDEDLILLKEEIKDLKNNVSWTEMNNLVRKDFNDRFERINKILNKL